MFSNTFFAKDKAARGGKARRLDLGFGRAPVQKPPLSPPSPASFTSPDIIDINGYNDAPYDGTNGPPTAQSQAERTSPRINLDFGGPSFSTEILGPQAIAFRRQGSALASVGPRNSYLPRTPVAPIPATAGPSTSSGFTGQNAAYNSQLPQPPFSASPAPSSGGSSGPGSGGRARDRFGSPANGSFGSAVGTPVTSNFERTRGERYGTPPADVSSPGLGSSYGSISLLGSNNGGSAAPTGCFLGPIPRNGSFGSAVGRSPLPALPASPRPTPKPMPKALPKPTRADSDHSWQNVSPPPASSTKNAMDSSFLFGSDEENDHDHDRHDDEHIHPFAAPRRVAPTPIRIPETPNNRRLPNLERSNHNRRPQSAQSDDDDSEMASAISGSTLAAALGDSFLYSPGDSARVSAGPISGKRSRPVTRQDSATLPRGEHPFLHSPYWRDRRVSGGEVIHSPADSIVPPVPPMPASLRRQSDPTLEGMVMPIRSASARLSRRASVSSMASSAPSGMSVGGLKRRSTLGGGTSLVLEDLLEAESPVATRQSRRISRITEADSPAPSAPVTPAMKSANSEGNGSSHSEYSAPPTAAVLGSAGLPPQPGSAGSGESEDVYNFILDGYSFVSPLGTPVSFKSQQSRRSKGLSGKSLTGKSPLGKTAFRPKDLHKRKSGKRASNASNRSGKSSSLLPIGVQPQQSQQMPKPTRAGSTTSSLISRSGEAMIPILNRQNSNTSTMFDRASLQSMGDFPLSPSETIEFFPSSLGESAAPTPAIISTAVMSTMSRPSVGPVLLNHRTIFTRPRNGSIPNPITVVRDSRDNSYNITLTDGADPESAVPPQRTALSNVSEERSAGQDQTFPETPAFSPMWSAGMPSSRGVPSMVLFGATVDEGGVTLSGPNGDIVIPPPLMRSASVAGPAVLATLRAKLAGQALSRSVTLSKPTAFSSQGLNGLASEVIQEGSSTEPSPVASRASTPPPVPSIPERLIAPGPLPLPTGNVLAMVVTQPTPVEHPAVAGAKIEGPSRSWSPAPALRFDLESPASSRASSPIRRLPITPAPSNPPSRQPSPLPTNASGSSTRSSIIQPRSSRSRSSSPFRSLPDAKPLGELQLQRYPSISRQGSATSLAYLTASGSTQPSPATSSSHLPTVLDESEDETSGPAPPSRSPTPPQPSSSPEIQPRLRQPPGRAAPPSPPDSLFFGDSTVPHDSFVPPPAYQSIADDIGPYRYATSSGPRPGGLERNNSTSPRAATSERNAGLATPETSSHPASPDALPPLSANVRGSGPRVSRMRPFGPRRPSATAAPAGPRRRNTSISSNHSNASASTFTASVGAGASARTAPPHTAVQSTGPQFQTSPVRWRGFTLDVAKWTFTSEQLQAIVSRAIRQSADATSLRLLPLDVLDKDIPEELEALEARAADSRAQYKVLAGRRSYLLTSITSATQESASASASDDHSQSHGEIGRLVYELTEITSSLDQLTEDMHSMSDQIRQIRALLDTHTYSALAMALRKLNGSFLKQAADVQELRQNVAALEGERDEAWKQAQEVAQEVDELNNMMADQVDMRASSRSGSSETYGVGSTSQQAIPEHGEMDTRHGMGLEPGAAAKIGSARSSKMSSRKNSVRASQISSSFRRSQRSSTYSYAGSSANRSTFGEIPPMPSMPVRRPLVVRTSDITERVSYALSSGGSPASAADNAAMVEAQQQLYAMLGITYAPLASRSPGSHAFKSPPVPIISPADVLSRDGLNTGVRRSRPLSLTASPSDSRPASSMPHRPSSTDGVRPSSMQQSEQKVILETLNYI